MYCRPFRTRRLARKELPLAGRCAARNVLVKFRPWEEGSFSVSSPEAFPPHLTVAITRLRRSFWARALGGQSPSPRIDWVYPVTAGRVSLSPRDQQAAYQLSGNGSSGQASPLSLAGFGG